MSLTLTEENYLKAIFKLSGNGKTSTNEIASYMQIQPGTVTEMLKRLVEKELIAYARYQPVSLTNEGSKRALLVIRKHRLWETFLSEKLGFQWSEVHAVAEQLEHIHSDLLVERLAEFLGHPKFDPHGDPIPDAFGQIGSNCFILLTEVVHGHKGFIAGYRDHSDTFLQFLKKLGLKKGDEIEVLGTEAFDGSISAKINNKEKVHLSKEAASHLLVTESLSCCAFGGTDQNCNF